MKIINDLQQGSADWLAMRRGKITMSRAKDLLTGGKGVTRTSYLQEVAAEQLSSDMGDHFMSRDMVRGTELESFAVQAYETVMNSTVQRVGFVLHEDERIGCSPDGLTKNGGIEIKCPLPKNHLKYASLTNVEKEHGAQMQGVMWICEREHLDFVSFCPWVENMPIIVHRLQRNDDIIQKLEQSAITGADEITAMVDEMKSAYVASDAVKAVAKQALQHWQSYNEILNAEVVL